MGLVQWEATDRLIDLVLMTASGWLLATAVQKYGWFGCANSFAESHLTGFPQPSSGRRQVRFAPDWASRGLEGAILPALPDLASLLEEPDGTHPFRLITALTHHFLNSTLTELLASRQQQKQLTALIHPEDYKAIGIIESSAVCLDNRYGAVTLHAQIFDGPPRWIIVAESAWLASGFIGKSGINILIGANSLPQAGDAAFYDTAVRLKKDP